MGCYHPDGGYSEGVLACAQIGAIGGARQVRQGSGSGSGRSDGRRHSIRFANIPLAQAHFGKRWRHLCGTHEAFTLPGSMVATEPVGANVTFGAAAQIPRTAHASRTRTMRRISPECGVVCEGRGGGCVR